MILRSTKGEKREISVKHNAALVWVTDGLQNEQFEIIDSLKGKTMSGEVSLLCKRSQKDATLDLWKYAEPWLPHLRTIRQGLSSKSTYYGLKTASNSFESAKGVFDEMIRDSNIRLWVHKPEEEEQFLASFLPE